VKLVTFEVPTSLGPFDRVGALVDGTVIDLIGAYGAYLALAGEPRAAELAAATVGPTMIDFFRGGATARAAADRALELVATHGDPGRRGPRGERVAYALDEVRLRAPVPRPNSLRDCTGFLRHMEEFLAGLGLPQMSAELFRRRPMYFKANPDMVLGPDDVVPWPRLGEKLDFEIEPAIFIGKEGVNVRAEDAAGYVAGYTILNDFSLRDLQQEEMSLGVNLYGLSKSKDAARYALGPCVVTADEIELEGRELVVRVNGEEWVRESTSEMTWTFADLVAFVSQDEPVFPGDCLAGGSPPKGYGAAIGRWIAPGDVVECEIEGIGVLRNTVGAPSGS
jgi:2-keto-4-pentenoate hydratase/2-oxohepta-3-ene-1,7-dioic acid hydratase in catechol pathway